MSLRRNSVWSEKKRWRDRECVQGVEIVGVGDGAAGVVRAKVPGGISLFPEMAEERNGSSWLDGRRRCGARSQGYSAFKETKPGYYVKPRFAPLHESGAHEPVSVSG